MSATTQNSRLLKALNAVDQIQKEKDEARTLLEDHEADANTEKMLREMLAGDGNDIDDATIAQAVALSRVPAPLPFSPLGQGLGRQLATVYIARDRWLGKVVGGSAAIMLALAVFWTGDTILEKRFEDQAQTAFTQAQEIRGQLPQAQAKVTALAGYPMLQAKAQQALTRATNFQAQVDETLGGRVPADKPTLAAVVRHKNEVTEQLKVVDTLAARGGALDGLKAQFAGFQQRGVSSSWPELAAAMNGQREAFAQAIAADDEHGASNALSKLGQMANADSGRVALLAAAQDLPESAREIGATIVADGEAALLAGRGADATAARTQLGELKATIAQAYTLRIVNEQGVKSGVWRYPNDNPSGKNFYVVVDAVDARDRPVEISVRNEETGRMERASRFAVRVPESFYNSVRDDKTDNGIVDNDLVGKKVAGQMDAAFSVPVAGGFITSW